jgi:hypothetical protein
VSVLDKKALLAPRLDEDDYEIPGVGTVRIRGLSRAQVIALRKIDDMALADAQMVAWGLVDPALSVDEAKAWQASSGVAEIEGLTVAIGELSGEGRGATKSGVPGVPA